jgi:hypothetical protein
MPLHSGYYNNKFDYFVETYDETFEGKTCNFAFEGKTCNCLKAK